MVGLADNTGPKGTSQRRRAVGYTRLCPIWPTWKSNSKSSAWIATLLKLRKNSPVWWKIIINVKNLNWHCQWRHIVILRHHDVTSLKPLPLKNPAYATGYVAAVTMVAPKNCFKKISLNLHYICFITLAVVPKRGNEWRDPTPRLSAWTAQLQKYVAAVTSRWRHCVQFDRLGN